MSALQLNRLIYQEAHHCSPQATLRYLHLQEHLHKDPKNRTRVTLNQFNNAPLKVFLSSFYGELRVEEEEGVYWVRVAKNGEMVRVGLDGVVPVIDTPQGALTLLSSLAGRPALELALYEKALWWKYHGRSHFQGTLSLRDYIHDFFLVPTEMLDMAHPELDTLMLRECLQGNKVVLLAGQRGCPVVSCREQGRFRVQSDGALFYQNSQQEDKHHMLLSLAEVRKLFTQVLVAHTSMAGLPRERHSMWTQSLGEVQYVVVVVENKVQQRTGLVVTQHSPGPYPTLRILQESLLHRHQKSVSAQHRQVGLAATLLPGLYCYYIEVSTGSPQLLHLSLLGLSLVSRKTISSRDQFLQVYTYWLCVSGLAPSRHLGITQHYDLHQGSLGDLQYFYFKTTDQHMLQQQLARKGHNDENQCVVKFQGKCVDIDYSSIYDQIVFRRIKGYQEGHTYQAQVVKVALYSQEEKKLKQRGHQHIQPPLQDGPRLFQQDCPMLDYSPPPSHSLVHSLSLDNLRQIVLHNCQPQKLPSHQLFHYVFAIKECLVVMYVSEESEGVRLQVEYMLDNLDPPEVIGEEQKETGDEFETVMTSQQQTRVRLGVQGCVVLHFPVHLAHLPYHYSLLHSVLSP